MAKTLIAFGSTEGHTRKIAETIQGWLLEKGLLVELADTSDINHPIDLAQFDSFIVAGSLHEGNHQRSLQHFVKEHATDLHPAAFLSVSLTAINKDEKHAAQAQACMDKFYEQTGWRPERQLAVAGALKYLEYNYLKRMLLRMISEKEGGPTDTSRDYEFTDWLELRAFVEEFVAGGVAIRP